MTKLSVNLNAIAQLRNRRDLPWPSVTGLARIALDAGAHGITVHPRPDERHIRRTDATEIGDLLKRDYPSKQFNVEGYPTDAFLTLVEAVKPDQVTLVPDDPSQATSDHGWDCIVHWGFLSDVVSRLHAGRMRVSLFVDADAAMAEAAARTSTDRIELYTGPYGHSFDPAVTAQERNKLVVAATAAQAAGLGVNAGHDLTCEKLPALNEAIPFIAEVSIGHALIADALVYGMADTVRRYLDALGDLTDRGGAERGKAVAPSGVRR
jgi:pyridoxine 5-phosphate synthase